MTEYSLRPATTEDRDFLYSLLETTLRGYVEELWGWDDTFQQERFDERFDPDFMEVICIEGKDVGCISLEHRGHELYLAEIELLPEYQNRGVGTSIIRAIMAEANKDGIPVRLQVLHNNPARRLYERLGFRVFSETPWHYRLEWPGDS